MAVPPVFTFQRGEPIRIDLVDVDGVFDDVTVVSKIKEAEGGKVPAKSAPTKILPTVTKVEATDADPRYWKNEVLGSVTADWAPGEYVMDSALMKDGAVVEVTEYCKIKIVQSVTP